MARKLEVIDADGHVLEPVDLWEKYTDPQYRDRAPKFVLDDEIGEHLNIDGVVTGTPNVSLPFTGLIGARDTGIPEKISYITGRKGGFDPHERLKDLDKDGIDATFLYPSAGLYVAAIEDHGLAAATARAYNRWLADYCSADPERLYGVGLLPFQSLEKTVEEIEFCAKELGFRSGFVRPNPYEGRAIHHPDNERIWEVAEALDFSIGFHEGVGGKQETLGAARFAESRAAKHCVAHLMEMEAAAVSVLMMGVADRHPNLRFAFLESGGGWMAGLLDRMDRHFEDRAMNDLSTSMKPSELFRRQCFIAFEPVEGSLSALADYIGSENILWATDYPHLDGYWDGPQKIRDMGLKGKTLANVLGGGAARYYGVDQNLSASAAAAE